MKITVIWSSPNEDGLTASAKNAILEGIDRKLYRVEEICLNKKKIRSCTACRDGWGTCRSQGHCCLADDLEEVYQSLADSDIIIWVTAVYWHDVTECMKTFFDRMRRCETSHNHWLAEKTTVCVTCAGGSGRGAAHCLSEMNYRLNHLQMKVVEQLPITRWNREYMLPALTHMAGCLIRNEEQTNVVPHHR